MKHKIDPTNWYNLKGKTMSDVGIKEVLVSFDDEEDKEEGTKIQYTKYCMMNLEAFEYLHEHFNLSDIGRITLLPMMTKTAESGQVSMNTLFKNRQTPHDYKSLKIVFEMSSSRFSALFNKLLKKNIIAKATTYKNDKKINIIMLNPYLTRRHINTDNEILKLFGKLVPTSKK